MINYLIHIFFCDLCQMGSRKWEQSKRELYCCNASPPWRPKSEGFIINPELAWIGASPDWMVICACHGDGVLEIKYPFKLSKTRNPSFCPGIGENGVMALRCSHKYMYQVQAKMHIAEVSFCDLDTTGIFYSMKSSRFGIFPHCLWQSGEFHQGQSATWAAGEVVYSTTLYSHRQSSHKTAIWIGMLLRTTCRHRCICTSGKWRRKHFHKTCLKLTRVSKTWKWVECRKEGGVGLLEPKM